MSMGAAISGTLRAETKCFTKPEETFEVGGFKGFARGKDVVFVAAGYMVHECLKRRMSWRRVAERRRSWMRTRCRCKPKASSNSHAQRRDDHHS